MTREDLVRLARSCVEGRTTTLADGSVEHRRPVVLSVDRWEPPEWVLEAMSKAYELGHLDERPF